MEAILFDKFSDLEKAYYGHVDNYLKTGREEEIGMAAESMAHALASLYKFHMTVTGKAIPKMVRVK